LSPSVPTLDRPLLNSYWVMPGRLLAGEYPGDPDPAQARLRLARLRDAGIDSFVDLTEEHELPPYSLWLPKQAEYLRCAIVDTCIPNNVSHTRGVLAAINAALAQEKGVYVHCRAGIGRTGLIIGCFLADEQSDGKVALKILNRLWRQSERALSWPKVPQTPQQADYVRAWPKLARAAPAPQSG
jgi:Dual specificity phosphatase, catalytic domain